MNNNPNQRPATNGTLTVPHKKTVQIFISHPTTEVMARKVMALDRWLEAANNAYARGGLTYEVWKDLVDEAHQLGRTMDNLFTRFQSVGQVKAQADRISNKKRGKQPATPKPAATQAKPATPVVKGSAQPHAEKGQGQAPTTQAPAGAKATAAPKPKNPPRPNKTVTPSAEAEL